MEFSFGDHVLDLDRRELRRGAELVALEPQVFDLLVYLVQNRDRVVSRDDLLAMARGARIVSDSTLTSRISAVRRAVGDSGETQRLIRTVSRKAFVSSATRASTRNLRRLAMPDQWLTPTRLDLRSRLPTIRRSQSFRSPI